MIFLPLSLHLLLSSLSYLLKGVKPTWLLSISLPLEFKLKPPYGSCSPKLNVYMWSLFQTIPRRRSYSCWSYPECSKAFKREIKSPLFFSVSALLFLSVKFQPELLPVVAFKIRTMHLVDPTLCPSCPVIRNMQLTLAPPCHLTKALNQRQWEPVWWCFSLTNSPLMQEALPLSAGFQSSSNHWWWLWCAIELMAHCCFSPFSSTWAGGHG